MANQTWTRHPGSPRTRPPRPARYEPSRWAILSPGSTEGCLGVFPANTHPCILPQEAATVTLGGGGGEVTERRFVFPRMEFTNGYENNLPGISRVQIRPLKQILHSFLHSSLTRSMLQITVTKPDFSRLHDPSNMSVGKQQYQKRRTNLTFSIQVFHEKCVPRNVSIRTSCLPDGERANSKRRTAHHRRIARELLVSV